jgi:poly(A) polymerase
MVAQRLREHGYESYYAGGCVRDRLLQVPIHDIDVVTSARPEEIQAIFRKTRAVGVHFGVVLVLVGQKTIEVATFREDGAYHDGRHPESVTYSDAQGDAQRRDFTMNGLFEDPETGEIIDYVGGVEDIKRRLLRCIGDPNQRFREDALRLMRAVRFAITKDFEIESQTYAAIKDNAQLLQLVSFERIREEFDKILLSGHPRRGIEMLVDTGLMRWIIPEVMDLIGCTQPPEWHPEGDVYTHTMMMLDCIQEDERKPSLPLLLATLLHDIGKPACRYVEPSGRIRFSGHDGVGRDMAKKILRHLKYPLAIIDEVSSMVGRHMMFIDVASMKTSSLRKFMSSPSFSDEMELHRADSLSSVGTLDCYNFLKGKMEEMEHQLHLPEPFLKGIDLIRLGLKPGPMFRKILSEVFVEQLEGRINSHDEAMQYVKDRLVPGGGFVDVD